MDIKKLYLIKWEIHRANCVMTMRLLCDSHDSHREAPCY